MAQVLESPARSLNEFRLLPRYTPSDGALPSVSLESPLCGSGEDEIRLKTPVLGAAMQAVTGEELAIALAQLGGMGVLPVSQPVDAQCAVVAAVKRYKAGFQTDVLTLSPHCSIAEVARIIQETGYRTFPVTDTGIFHGKLLGVITDKDFDARRDLEVRVGDRMKKDVQVAVGIDDLDTANRRMIELGRGFLPVVSPEGTLLSVVFKKDRDKHLRHPDETVDAAKRLRVAAAVSTHREDHERVEALLAHEVDVLVIDASDGHTEFQRQLVRFIKSRSNVGLVAGNVVTAEGFRFLAEEGADAVKVGMGIGSGCTTQEVKATGRGQATALMEVAAERDHYAEETGRRVPLVADGGIRSTSEAAVALALGADTLMLGNLLARYSESPGGLVRGPRGELYKEYWMEGSLRAANTRRYAQARETFFEEGVEGYVPHAGSIHDGLPRLATILRSSLATAGCRSLAELHAHAVLEPQSPASCSASAVGGMTPLALSSGSELDD